jgi:hypothetical protein
MARPFLTWCKAQAFDTMTSTALVARFLSLPPLPFTPENAWLTLPVPDAWDLALRMLPGVRHLSTANLLIYMNGRLAPSTRVSYSSTWSVFIHFINERYLHAPVPWHVWVTHMVSMHQAFCVHYLHSHAYHLTRITPVLNSTLELMTVNGGVAEVFIRIARGVSRSARYATSESVIPILQWCLLPHGCIAELRLKLIILLKLESLRRSQIRFSANKVQLRIFQPKEIKNSIGRFGPVIVIHSNRRFPTCCIPTLLKAYLTATAECAPVQAATAGSLIKRSDHRLFVALTAPCRPISANTIATLGASVLHALHIPGTSHILRGMAASHIIKAGADRSRVLAHMNCSEKTFCQFYWRPPLEDAPLALAPSDSLTNFLWSWLGL